MMPIFISRRIVETGSFKAVLRRFQAIPLVLTAVAGISTCLRAETMRVGIESSAAPMSFLQADGRIGGFSVDLMHAIAREMKFEIQPVVGPWEEIFTKFKAREIDVLASAAYTKERDAFMDFGVSHLVMTGHIFTRKGERSIQSPSDLANVRVGTQRDSVSHEYLRTRGWDRQLVFVKDLQDSLHAVSDGRCDAVVVIGVIGNHIVRSDRLANVEASKIALRDFVVRLHCGVPAGEVDRLAVLNEGLARIRANGTYDQIHEKWMGPLEPRELRWNDYRRVLLPLVAIAAVGAAAFWWQRRMLRKLAEQTERLRGSEERLRHVLDGSEDGFWDWDMQSGRIERSERWAAMLGYTLEEVSATLAAGTALVHPDDLPGYTAWHARLHSRTTDRCDIEYRMRTKSGEWRWILDRGKVVARAPDGRPLRMCGTHTDITERKLTEAALHESQTMLKRSAQLLEQSQKAARVGGWESDLRTGRVYWTGETYRIHDTTPDEFYPTRDSILDFYAPESRQRLLGAVERAIRDGTPFNLELEVVTARKRRVHVQSAGIAEMENGRVVKLYGSFRDITAEKAAEQERETLRLKMLEAQKLESLGVLAGGIAHDFNNLLTVILANATFIREDGAGGTANDESLAHIEAAARRAADLCRQMLAYAGKGNFVVEPVDVGGLVRDTTELIHVSISKKARLELELATTLPCVDADASQLRQVVMNLVINASEALNDAPGVIRIRTSVGRPAPTAAGAVHSFDLPEMECVCLEVSDTGQGMSPATLARIFDPFFTTKFAGRGLGLAAVLGIVRAHHGALTVDSTPGAGSSFRLYLPGSARGNAAQKGTRSASPFPGASARGTILLADDERVVLETADLVLRSFGYQTVLANDGREAVERFRATPTAFCAVLLDLTMPHLDGAEALRLIRSINPNAPALVMSGFSEQDVINRLRGLGQVSVVRKPFTRDTLLAQIASVATPAHPTAVQSNRA